MFLPPRRESFAGRLSEEGKRGEDIKLMILPGWNGKEGRSEEEEGTRRRGGQQEKREGRKGKEKEGKEQDNGGAV